jgi:glycosyltransferase involved in cell wall biosynthesis
MSGGTGNQSGTERPQLAYVVNSLNPGGTEKLVVEMSRSFNRDFRVQVYCLDEPGHWAGQLRQQGIPVHCVWRQPGLDLAVAARLAGLFRAAGTRIVHAHQCTAWFYAALSRFMNAGPRLLLEEHGRFYPEADVPLRRLVNRLFIRPLTHRFVAVSADIGQRLVRYEGLDPRRIEVIYNGVMPQAAVDAAERLRLRAELGFGPDDVVIGTVGRFDPIKNLPLLIESLRRVATRDPRVRGLLVGDGPEFAAVSRLVREAGFGQRVVLTGFREDARALTQCMDLFVLASLSEGTSMALLEAMSAGIAVAVTRVGGNPEIVLENTTGWVVPSGDVDAMAAALEQAAASPEMRVRLARAGLERFQAQFTFDGMIDRYRDIYRQFLDVPEA